MIVISDAAESKIKEILDRNPGKYLRLVIEGTGCGGPYLKMSMDEANPHEKIIKVNGIDILVSDDVQKYAEATTLNIFIDPDGKDFL